MNGYKTLLFHFLYTILLYWLSFAFGFCTFATPVSGNSVSMDQAPLNLFVNNLGAVGFAAAGAVSGGLSTVVVVIANGFFFGGFVRGFLEPSLGLGTLAKVTVAHGVPELLGFWLASAVGLSGITKLIRVVGSHRSPAQIPSYTLWTAVAISLVLTVIAALVEQLWSIPLAKSGFPR